MHSPGCAGKKINCRRQAAKYRPSKKRRERKRGKKGKRKRKRREICKKNLGGCAPDPALDKKTPNSLRSFGAGEKIKWLHKRAEEGKGRRRSDKALTNCIIMVNIDDEMRHTGAGAGK